MKKVLLAMSAAFILYACGGGGDKTAEVKKDTPAIAATTPAGPSEDDVKALELIGTKNCTGACHAMDKKVIGPAYIDVSKKYESTQANIDSLANKVVKGGSGVWGDIPMTPNPVTIEEAKIMVTYILSLKNKQ
jgi:cytochrome c